LGRPYETGVIEFTHCAADGGATTANLIFSFPDTEHDHAVVAAVVSICDLEEQGARREA
jgi:hypothetical protein